MTTKRNNVLGYFVAIVDSPHDSPQDACETMYLDRNWRESKASPNLKDMFDVWEVFGAFSPMYFDKTFFTFHKSQASRELRAFKKRFHETSACDLQRVKVIPITIDFEKVAT